MQRESRMYQFSESGIHHYNYDSEHNKLGGKLMSRSKKIIGLVLAVIMAVSMMTVAFADYDPATLTASITIETTANQLDPGDTATITVKATTNYYVSTFSIPIFYDNAYVTVSGASTPITDAVVATEASQGGSKFYNGTSLTSADTGVVAAVYVADFGDTLTQFNNTVVLTFTVTAGATTGVTDVIRCESGSIKTSTNSVGALYIAANKSATNTMDSLALNNENIDITAATQSIDIGSAEPELILTATGTSNGVIIDTHKTFGGLYYGVVYGFPQLATNTFRTINYITTNLTTTAGDLTASNLGRTIGTTGYGTGTTITVGSKVYVIVIFADVDGNGLINGQDTTATKNAVNNPGTLANNSVQRMAANCQQVNNGTMLHTLNGQDTTACKQYVNNASGKFNPATLASYQNSKNNFYQ